MITPMQITRKNVFKVLHELSNHYNIRLHFTESMGKYDHGCARYWVNSISISKKQSSRSMISTFFHEMGHIYCFENGLWKSFHINKSIEDLTRSEALKYLRTALKAERWVDNWAKKEMKKHFPKMKYIPGYDSDQSGREFTNSIKKMIKI